MIRLASKILSLIIVLSWTACKDDVYHYPSVLTEFVELDTDNDGNLKLIRTDDQKEYFSVKEVKLAGTTPDSTYRVQCKYQPEEEEYVLIYDLKLLVSPHPKDPSFFNNEIKADPVKLTSIWKSGDYINLHLGAMTKDEAKHKFHFVKQERSNSNGNRRVDLLLYHDQNGDPEAYTQDILLSCPLSSLALNPGDSIYFHIRTYDGIKRFGYKK